MSIAIEAKPARGALNPGSIATMDQWQWSDFSEAIVRTARQIAADDPMLWGVEDCLWGDDHCDVPEKIAQLSEEVSRSYLTQGSDKESRACSVA